MVLRHSMDRPVSSGARPLQIQVRGLSGRSSEWEILGALASLASEHGYEVEIEWLLDAESTPPLR